MDEYSDHVAIDKLMRPERYHRTLHSAFGPYAELTVEQEGPTLGGYLIAALLALILVFISWAMQ